ncbi:MAG: ABC transporter ATP-binding protein [Holophagales bacterium]|nr:ABC transporter ATP-binding protein [Holophagales bacterium]MYF94998.1 ABC transporter ATP-binding protein [Holophagales bacterium]
MLVFDHVSKCFGDLRAVDDLSFELEAGEVFGLLGPNGAGKTTAINMAVGLFEPDEGVVRFADEAFDRNPRDAENRRSLGLAPQSIALYEQISGADNLRFFGRLHGLRGTDLEERVAACLDFADLTDVGKKVVSKYSGGMQRRLNLAVAIIHDPELVLLDEPTVGVDPQSRNAIFERVEQLRDGGKQVVYTTHYMEEAQRLCDRVAIIDHGRLMALDTVPALIAAHGGPGNLEVWTGDGESRHETTDPLATLADLQARQAVDHFQYLPPDLETVFLNLTGRALRD